MLATREFTLIFINFFGTITLVELSLNKILHILKYYFNNHVHCNFSSLYQHMFKKRGDENLVGMQNIGIFQKKKRNELFPTSFPNYAKVQAPHE